MTTRRTAGPVERKAKRDLASLPADYKNSAIGESYLILARQLDEGPPAREIASISREMRLCYGQLLDMGGTEKPDSKVDELRKRREARDIKTAEGTSGG